MKERPRRFYIKIANPQDSEDRRRAAEELARLLLGDAQRQAPERAHQEGEAEQ